jgi:hypothetical protein
VRHPYYLANYIIDSSFCLITGNMYLVFMYPFLFFWAYGPVMKQEEDHLRTIHGERYALFADITPQAFPGPFSLRGFKRLLFGFTALRITPKELNRLSRFWGVAFFLAVLQELRVDALPLLRWSHIRRDWDAMLFLILALLMLTMNLIVPRTGDINQK